MLLNASGTYAETYNDQQEPTGKNGFLGHVGGAGRWDLDDDWRAGFELGRASDSTYLLRYKLLDRFRFIDRNTLTTRPYVEGFRGRNYAGVEAFAFQGLRVTDDPGQAPYVLPRTFYQYYTEPDRFGGYFRFDQMNYVIARTQGVNDQHAAGVAGYYLPYVASTGEVWSLQATLQGDLFNTSSLGTGNDGFVPSDTGFHTRLFPQVALGWRYPFVRQDGALRTLVEPVLSAVAAPRIGGQNNLPNEDSLAIDLDDTNLFRPNRFTGYDRVESGQRINYGFNSALRLSGTPYRAGFFVGQSYRFQQDGKFPPESGLEDFASDIVGRFRFTAHEWVEGLYVFNLNKDNLSAARTTGALRLGPDAFNLSFAYTYIEQATQPTLTSDLEQLASRLSVRIDENWRFVIRDIRQFGQDAQVLRFNATVLYEDECFLFGVDFEKRNIGTPGDPPDTSVVLRFALRNLGETRFSAY
jgi:LPS-assembly protein